MQSAQLGMAATSLSPWERSAEAEAELLQMEAEDGWQRCVCATQKEYEFEL